MKKHILLLATVGCLVLPAITHADSLEVKKKKAAKPTATAFSPSNPDPRRVVYYISTESRTGSNIPMVRRAYGGRIDSASSPAVYGSTDISRTGANDVGTALYKLDPSFTTGRSR